MTSDGAPGERRTAPPAPPERDASRAERSRLELCAAAAVVGAIALLVVGKSALGLVSPRPSEEQCGALLDRYLDVASRAGDPRVDDDDVARARERAALTPMRAADLKSCREHLTRAQVACGVAAANIDDLERCMQ